MNDNVITPTFGAPKDTERYVRACGGCHCSSFMVYDDGEAVCASCKQPMDYDGPWFEATKVNLDRLIDVDAAHEAGNPVFSITQMENSTAALRRMFDKALAEADGMVFAMCALDNGSIRYWHADEAFEGENRKEWSRSRLEIMIREYENSGS